MIRIDVFLLENNEWVSKTDEVIYPVVLNKTLDESLDDGAFTIYGVEWKQRLPAFTKCKIKISDIVGSYTNDKSLKEGDKVNYISFSNMTSWPTDLPRQTVQFGEPEDLITFTDGWAISAVSDNYLMNIFLRNGDSWKEIGRESAVGGSMIWNSSDGNWSVDGASYNGDGKCDLGGKIVQEINVLTILNHITQNNVVYSETRYYYANDTVEQTVFVQPYKYNHNIRLIEPTKILERYIICGMAVSQPVAAERPVKYLDNVVDILLATNPPRRVGDPQTFFLDETLRSRLHAHKSPEYRWSCRMTLFECLHDIGRYIGAMPRLIPSPSNDKLFNTVSFEYFGRIENNIAELQYSSYASSQDENQYCTELETYAENMIEEDDNVMVYPAPGCWITARSDELLPTEENLYIPTPTPIERVVKVLVRNVRAQGEQGGTDPDGIIQATIDITPFIVTEQEWLTLDVKNGDMDGGKYKNNTLYYTPGRKNIPISAAKHNEILWFNRRVYNDLIYSCFLDEAGEPVRVLLKSGSYEYNLYLKYNGVQGAQNLKQWEFQIHYVPITSAKIKAVKQL